MAFKPVLAHASCVFSSLLASVKSVKSVGYKGVVDHRSRLPVLSPLRSCVDRSRV